MHKQADKIRHELLAVGVDLKITTPTEAFGWVDDGRHVVDVKVTLPPEWEAALAAVAVARSAETSSD